MTPKTDPAALTALADLLDDRALYDVVFALVGDIRDAYPRPRNHVGDPLDVEDGVLGDTLIAELRRIATEMKPGSTALEVIAGLPGAEAYAATEASA